MTIKPRKIVPLIKEKLRTRIRWLLFKRQVTMKTQYNYDAKCVICGQSIWNGNQPIFYIEFITASYRYLRGYVHEKCLRSIKMG